MAFDDDMHKALVGKLTNFKPTVPVFRIRDPRVDELEEAAVRLIQRFAKAADLGELRHRMKRKDSASVFHFQEGIRAQVFHASGAIMVHRGWQPMEKIIALDAEKADLGRLQSQAEDAVKLLELAPTTQRDEPRFERLWRLKASGMTQDGKRGPTSLTRVVGAFRRYLGGMPVWGRASMFVQLAAEGQVAAAGVDWRMVVGEAIDKPRVLAPEEGANRVLAELQTFQPGKRYTLKDYIPDSFALGYLSLPKRRAQTVMQPVYVAMFKPADEFPSIGRVIAVPAATTAYESICRPNVMPPLFTRAATRSARAS